MLRIDGDVLPTMAKTPTVGVWELELLRTIDNVVRLGHIRYVTPGEIVLDHGEVPLAPGALVVHCAASGLQYPSLVPLWSPDKIRLQTVRVGFPCFCAALAGYVEATRDDDAERNRLCPPSNLPNTPTDWAQMQVRGTVADARRTELNRTSLPGPTTALSTRRGSSRGSATSRSFEPPQPGWTTSPTADSPGWANSPTCHSRSARRPRADPYVGSAVACSVGRWSAEASDGMPASRSSRVSVDGATPSLSAISASVAPLA